MEETGWGFVLHVCEFACLEKLNCSSVVQQAEAKQLLPVNLWLSTSLLMQMLEFKAQNMDLLHYHTSGEHFNTHTQSAAHSLLQCGALLSPLNTLHLMGCGVI